MEQFLSYHLSVLYILKLNYFTDYVNFAFYLRNNNDTLRIIKKIKLLKCKGHDGVSTGLLK